MDRATVTRGEGEEGERKKEYNKGVDQVIKCLAREKKRWLRETTREKRREQGSNADTNHSCHRKKRYTRRGKARSADTLRPDGRLTRGLLALFTERVMSK